MTIIYALIVLGLLIFIHEFGHFIVAKFCKITVLEFSLGMGPKLLSKKGKETMYTLRLFPIGGYVKMDGEDEESENKNAFSNKNVYQRMAVVVAGAVMNILLGFVICFVLCLTLKDYSTTVIEQVITGYPAESAGLQAGDKIVKINGSNVLSAADFNLELFLNGDRENTVTVERNGVKNDIKVTPVINDNRYVVGIKFGLNETFGQIVKNSFKDTLFMIKMIFTSFKMLFTGTANISDVSGPVGIVNEIGSAAKSGFLSLLNLVALITINLGVFNLLPIPALDGGRLVFLIVEAVTRKRVPPEKEGMVHMIGLIFLLLVMVLVTSNDIFKLVKG